VLPATADIRTPLQSIMLRAAGPVRTAAGLAASQRELRALGEQADGGRPSSDPLVGLASRNLLTVAELILAAASRREESRGSHYRADCPARDDVRWLRNIFVERGVDGPHLAEQPADLLYLKPA
jgi:L-aspartate oxidase